MYEESNNQLESQLVHYYCRRVRMLSHSIRMVRVKQSKNDYTAMHQTDSDASSE